MTTKLEERVAALETKATRNELDISLMFKFLREHMEKEEKDREQYHRDRKEFAALLSQMNLKLTSDLDTIAADLGNQKSFWAGMLFAFTGIGGAVGWVVSHFKIGS